MTLEIYLVRHGQSEVNLNGASRKIWCGRNTWSELTEKGIQQAKALGQYLKGMQFDAVYASSTIRTQQTARYCMQEMGYDWPQLEVRIELAELDHGNLEGKVKDYDKGAVKDFWTFAPGKESQKDVYERVCSWIMSECKGRVLVFTHENVIKCLIAGLLDLDKDLAHKMKIDNASVTRLIYDGSWKLAEIDYDEHIET
ncbi:histidine phosphatase family protein [Candidatus Woesearchaeota archaeon]|nr:histidine phosphatase family protein [Candidatus Woesearchaeota archaeon]